MKIILSEKLPRILKNKKELEKKIGIKISNRGKEVTIEGSPEKEFVAEKVIDAINFGFPIEAALSLKDEEVLFEILNLKDYTKSKNMSRVRGRVIGTGGGALRTLQELTKCNFEIKDNQVAIIGHADCIKNAQDAITSLAQGTKHANVYARLEKNQPEPILDLGLKKEE